MLGGVCKDGEDRAEWEGGQHLAVPEVKGQGEIEA